MNVALPDTNVCLDAELLPASGVESVSAPERDDARDIDAECVGANLRDDRVSALPDVHRALVERHAAVAAEPDLMVEGFGSEVFRSRATCRDPTTADRRGRGIGSAASASTRPGAAAGVEHSRKPTPRAKT